MKAAEHEALLKEYLADNGHKVLEKPKDKFPRDLYNPKTTIDIVTLKDGKPHYYEVKGLGSQSKNGSFYGAVKLNQIAIKQDLITYYCGEENFVYNLAFSISPKITGKDKPIYEFFEIEEFMSLYNKTTYNQESFQYHISLDKDFKIIRNYHEPLSVYACWESYEQIKDIWRRYNLRDHYSKHGVYKCL